MDRSEEFKKVVDIYRSESVVDSKAAGAIIVSEPLLLSSFVKLAMETFGHFENNGELIKRMDRL